MENNENKKPGAESTGGNKPNHKKHHHNRNRHNKPKNPAATDVKVPAPEAAAPAPSGSNQHHKSNQVKKNNQQSKPRTESENNHAPAEAARAEASGTSKNRSKRNDRPKKVENDTILTSLPENEFDFLPSRSKSESDFLSLGKTDDAYLDQMPLDPTLDMVFADTPVVENKEIEGPEIVGIRFEHGSKVYYFDPQGKSYRLGTNAIVETAQGLEFGEVVISNRKVAEDQVVQPLRPVIREATKEDLAHHEDNRRRQHEAFKICLGKIADHGLDMKLVNSQYTFDNTKLIFFFTSAGRVDFRALVKDLASVFRTRIELRQIGIRDEARMIGGFGVCGRKLCCAGFLPNFVQVSIKMAKEQGLSINAAKISGTCGRLMCCLRYEQDAYEREIALMPPVDSLVDTPDGKGVVIDIFPIAGNVKVKLNDKQDIVPKNYHMRDIRVITKAERKKSNDSDGSDGAE